MKKLTSFSFYFLFFGAYAAFMPYLVLYYQSLGFSGAQIGLLSSLSPLLALVGTPLWTGLADATRRHRLIMSLAIVVTVAVGVAFPWLTAFVPILAAIVFYSLFSSPIISFSDAATMHALEGRQEQYGRVRLGGTFGWGLVSLVMGTVVENHGLRLAFWGSAGLMFLALLVSQNFSYQKDSPGQSPLSGARALLRNQRYVLFLVMALICAIGFASVNIYLFAYMEEQNIPKSIMGVAMTISTLSELPVLLFSNHLLKRLKPHGLMVLGMAVTGVRLLLYAAFSTIPGVLAFQMINGLTFPAVWVAGVSYANQSAPPGLGATSQGLFGAMVLGIGAAIGGFSGGLLLEALGGRMMFLLFGGLVLLGLGVIVWLERRCPPETPRKEAAGQAAGLEAAE